jgi:hypothetical protein
MSYSHHCLPWNTYSLKFNIMLHILLILIWWLLSFMQLHYTLSKMFMYWTFFNKNKIFIYLFSYILSKDTLYTSIFTSHLGIRCKHKHRQRWAAVRYAMIWRRDCKYQRDNQNSYFEEKQTIQWPKEKVQKDKQRSTKHTHQTKDRIKRTHEKLGVNSGALKG